MWVYWVHTFSRLLWLHCRQLETTLGLERKALCALKAHSGKKEWERIVTCRAASGRVVTVKFFGLNWRLLFSRALSLCLAITEGSVAAIIIILQPFVLSTISDHYCYFLWRNCSHFHGYLHSTVTLHYILCCMWEVTRKKQRFNELQGQWLYELRDALRYC